MLYHLSYRKAKWSKWYRVRSNRSLAVPTGCFGKQWAVVDCKGLGTHTDFDSQALNMIRFWFIWAYFVVLIVYFTCIWKSLTNVINYTWKLLIWYITKILIWKLTSEHILLYCFILVFYLNINHWKKTKSLQWLLCMKSHLFVNQSTLLFLFMLLHAAHENNSLEKCVFLPRWHKLKDYSKELGINIKK